MYILAIGMDVLTHPNVTTRDKKYLTPLFLDNRKKPSRGSYAKGAIILCAALYVLFEKVFSHSGNNHKYRIFRVSVLLN